MATRVKLLQALGHPVGPTTLKGTELSVDEAQAERMVAGGIAERVEGEKRGRKPKGASTATSKKAETAEKRETPETDE